MSSRRAAILPALCALGLTALAAQVLTPAPGAPLTLTLSGVRVELALSPAHGINLTFKGARP